MAFTRLVDGWSRTRRQRTPLPWGPRVASMEADLGADMSPGRMRHWAHLPIHDETDPEQDREHETEQEHQVDEHQVDEHQVDEHQVDEHQVDEQELELEDDEVEP